MVFKTRLWCGTSYNMDFDWETWFNNTETVRYIGVGQEKTKKGLDHWQFFLYFENPRGSKQRTAKFIDPGCHVEPCRGTLAQNETYCSKEGKFKHFGTKPAQGERTDLADIMEDIKLGVSELEIAERAPRKWLMYRRGFEAYRTLCQPDRTWKTEVAVFWGPPGTGKSTAARKWLDHDYDKVKISKGGGEHLLGYKNNPNVLLDDLDHGSLCRDTLLNMCDEGIDVVNVKHGEMKWNARKLAITSNYDPRTWFGGDPEAVMRRVEHCTYMTTVWNRSSHG